MPSVHIVQHILLLKTAAVKSGFAAKNIWGGRALFVQTLRQGLLCMVGVRNGRRCFTLII
jgi:hypothetical protein